MTNIRIVFISLMAALFFSACGGELDKVESKKVGDNTVVIHELGDPDYLNPVTSGSAGATYVQTNIFQSLIEIDFKSLEFIKLILYSLE